MDDGVDDVSAGKVGGGKGKEKLCSLSLSLPTPSLPSGFWPWKRVPLLVTWGNSTLDIILQTQPPSRGSWLSPGCPTNLLGGMTFCRQRQLAALGSWMSKSSYWLVLGFPG